MLKKAQKAENTSHLSSDSDPETQSLSKRSKQKPFRFRMSSDEEISPKKQPKQSKKRFENNETTHSENTFTLPVFPSFPESRGKI